MYMVEGMEIERLLKFISIFLFGISHYFLWDFEASCELRSQVRRKNSSLWNNMEFSEIKTLWHMCAFYTLKQG